MLHRAISFNEILLIFSLFFYNTFPLFEYIFFPSLSLFLKKKKKSILPKPVYKSFLHSCQSHILLFPSYNTHLFIPPTFSIIKEDYPHPHMIMDLPDCQCWEYVIPCTNRLVYGELVTVPFCNIGGLPAFLLYVRGVRCEHCGVADVTIQECISKIWWRSDIIWVNVWM